jgi:hypothetical protein
VRFTLCIIKDSKNALSFCNGGLTNIN